MKAILKFDLDDPYDVKAHLRCTKAVDAYLVLLDFDEFLCKEMCAIEDTYEDETSEPEMLKLLKKIKERFRYFLEDRNINLQNELE